MAVDTEPLAKWLSHSTNNDHPRDAGADWNPEEEREQQLFEELVSRYESALCTSADLETMKIRPRAPLMGKWMKEGDLGFVYGERGGGKTWLVDAIVTHLSTGKELHGWEVPEAIDIIYVDGEMPADACRDRLMGLAPKNKRLFVLHHELLFEKTGLIMNLTDPKVQRVLTDLCIRKKVKMLVLDNLSCLFRDMKENDADEWEKVLNWLLDLRRRRVSVLIVAHGSRSGTMRGTSRREDAAFWVIKVEPLADRAPDERGAYFETTFQKQRNSDFQEWPRKWTFKTESDGKVTIGCDEVSFDEKVMQLIQDGLTSVTDIAEAVGRDKSVVSRACTRLVESKLIEKSGRSYAARGLMKKTNGATNHPG